MVVHDVCVCVYLCAVMGMLAMALTRARAYLGIGKPGQVQSTSNHDWKIECVHGENNGKCVRRWCTYVVGATELDTFELISMYINVICSTRRRTVHFLFVGLCKLYTMRERKSKVRHGASIYLLAN